MSPYGAQVPKQDSSLLLTLWLGSTVLLAFGLTRPVIQIAVNVEGVLQEALDRQPVVGLLLQERGLKLSDIASKLPPSSMTRQSIISSAFKLYRLGSFTAATLILVFSIVLPICKQIALFTMLMSLHAGSKNLASITTAVHKWAMLDVFVLSMVVLALSSASSWSATLLDGFYWFLGYFFTAGTLGAKLSREITSNQNTSLPHPTNVPTTG
jgi:hypothetical protein